MGKKKAEITLDIAGLSCSICEEVTGNYVISDEAVYCFDCFMCHMEMMGDIPDDLADDTKHIDVDNVAVGDIGEGKTYDKG